MKSFRAFFSDADVKELNKKDPADNGQARSRYFQLWAHFLKSIFSFFTMHLPFSDQSWRVWWRMSKNATAAVARGCLMRMPTSRGELYKFCFRETVSIPNSKCVALPRKQIWLLLEIMLTSSVRILSTFDQLGENRVWPYLLSGALSTTLSRPVFPRRSWSSWSSVCRWKMVVRNAKDIHVVGFRPEPQGASSMTLTGHVSKTLSFWTIHFVTPLTDSHVCGNFREIILPQPQRKRQRAREKG